MAEDKRDWDPGPAGVEGDPWVQWAAERGITSAERKKRPLEPGEHAATWTRTCAMCGERFWTGRNRFSTEYCGVCRPRDGEIDWAACPDVVERLVELPGDERTLERHDPVRRLP